MYRTTHLDIHMFKCFEKLSHISKLIDISSSKKRLIKLIENNKNIEMIFHNLDIEKYTKNVDQKLLILIISLITFYI